MSLFLQQAPGCKLRASSQNLLDALSPFIRFKHRSPASHICYNAKCQAQKQKMTVGHCIPQTETLCLRKINSTMRSETLPSGVLISD